MFFLCFSITYIYIIKRKLHVGLNICSLSSRGKKIYSFTNLDPALKFFFLEKINFICPCHCAISTSYLVEYISFEVQIAVSKHVFISILFYSFLYVIKIRATFQMLKYKTKNQNKFGSSYMCVKLSSNAMQYNFIYLLQFRCKAWSISQDNQIFQV